MITNKVISFLQYSKVAVNKEALLIQFYRDMDLSTWELIKEHLVAMKYLQVNIDPRKGDETYTWKGPMD